jgi:hypothetical protein
MGLDYHSRSASENHPLSLGVLRGNLPYAVLSRPLLAPLTAWTMMGIQRRPSLPEWLGREGHVPKHGITPSKLTLHPFPSPTMENK